jgi:hypothetical protein
MQPFTAYYRNALQQLLTSPPKPEDGIPADKLTALLKDRNLQIPQALFDYYTLAGHLPINTQHNELRPPDKLDWLHNHLVFMDENQQIVYWAIAPDDLTTPDPTVYQGVNDTPIAWTPEPHTLSRFLIAMWHWTLTGNEPPPT